MRQVALTIAQSATVILKSFFWHLDECGDVKKTIIEVYACFIITIFILKHVLSIGEPTSCYLLRDVSIGGAHPVHQFQHFLQDRAGGGEKARAVHHPAGRGHFSRGVRLRLGARAFLQGARGLWRRLFVELGFNRDGGGRFLHPGEK